MPNMNQTDSDADLVGACLKGDEEALRFLYERHIPGVYNFIARTAPPDIDVEDIVQESFIKAWRNLKRFDRTKNFKTWIFTIAKNTLLDRLKSNRTISFSLLEEGMGDDKPAFDPADKRPLPDEVLQMFESDKSASELLGSLKPAARAVVVMHALEDLSFREVGEILGEPMDTVKTRYRRAIQELARILASKPGNGRSL